tara:strand:+ start:508 stop:771 length:264 start_codon:yes stop_codon:yes gene_type:complete
MSRFATDEIPEELYRDFVDGLLEGTIGRYRQEMAEKYKEIANDLRDEDVSSPELLRKMYKLSIVYKNLLEKKKLQTKKTTQNYCLLN